MSGYIPAHTISGIHLPPPILPSIGMTTGAVDPKTGTDPNAVAQGIADSNRKFTWGLPPKGAGWPTWIGYGAGALGGFGALYLWLPKRLSMPWRLGVSAASSLFVLGPIGGYLGMMAE